MSDKITLKVGEVLVSLGQLKVTGFERHVTYLSRGDILERRGLKDLELEVNDKNNLVILSFERYQSIQIRNTLRRL